MSWLVGSGRVKGSIHQSTQTPCQDYSAYLIEGSTLYIAISDGAGSQPLSHLGSEFLCTNFLKKCEGFFSRNPARTNFSIKIFQDIFHQLHQDLIQYAHTLRCPIPHLSATFTACIASPDFLIGGQVGDGFLVGQQKDQFDLLLWEEQKEFINETHFLSEKNYQGHFIEMAPYAFLALGTDGVSGVAIDQKQNIGFAGFFNPFAEFMQTKPFQDTLDAEMTNFLSSPRFDLRTDDDRTLVVAQWIE